VTTRTTPPSEETVRGVLRGVIDPELGDNVVDLGMVRQVSVGDDGQISVEVALTIAGCPLRGQLRRDVESRVTSLPGVSSVVVHTAEMNADERRSVMVRARWKASQRPERTDISSTTRVVAVSSGKGGVGKSSVTVNLATALAARGLTVGLLDADIWGFSIPRMLGLDGRMEAEGTSDEWLIVPMEKKVGPGRLEVVSMGLLTEGEDDAIMWKGLLLNRALQHFVENVRWGELDYLLVDMPPGTGDIQMGLARLIPRTELLIVTTPALAAQKVAARAADMARKCFLRVAGVIENMGPFTCGCGQRHAFFGEGGGRRLAEEIGAPLIGSIPLDPAVAAGGDSGVPVALDGEGPVAAAFATLAERLVGEIVPLVEMTGCTARLLGRVEAALDGGPSIEEA